MFCSGVWYGVLVRGKRHIAGLPWAAQPLGPAWGACHEGQRAQKGRGLGPRRRRAGAEAWCQLQRAGAPGAEPSHIISPSLGELGERLAGPGGAVGPEREHSERKEGGSESGRGTDADRKWGKKVLAGGRPGPGAAGAGARRG